jgi:hypothetical protein
MVSTRPIFYFVPITKALSNGVATGQYPEAQTTVEKCMTSLGHNRDRRVNEGMETPEYRRVAFERFLAFKALAREYWQTFICLTDFVRVSQKFFCLIDHHCCSLMQLVVLLPGAANN